MKALKLPVLTLLLLLPALAPAQGMDRIKSPDGARVYFITPDDGATVSSPVTIRFGLEGMGIAPAGVVQQGTGHHHLLIDLGDSEMPGMDRPLPTSDQLIHFGGGQTEVDIELEPGEHTLQLLVGDYRHVPHNPPVISERITITVE